MQEMSEKWVRSLDQEDSLEEGMATHSSVLAWRIPWTEEPGGLQSMGTPRVRHDWAHTHTQSDKELLRTSLVIQRLRIRLPVQGPWVQSLMQEDPTCLRAAKHMWHNCWAWALSRARADMPPQWEACAPQLESSPYLPQLEKSPQSNEDPA